MWLFFFVMDLAAAASDYWRVMATSYRPGVVEFWAFLATQILTFWVPATFYLGIDLIFPQFSLRHKIQSERRQPTWLQIKECISHVFVSTLSGTIQHGAILWFFGFNKTLFRVTPDIPSFAVFATDFAYALVAREILFYYSHRAFHHPALYKRFHKQHHKFTAPLAFAAQYAHPLEHLVANTLPIVLPLAVRRAHLLSFLVFLGYMLWETASVHSGYDFVTWPMPLNPARVHDLHHEKFMCNFGSVGLMDWLHQTGPDSLDRAKSNKGKIRAE